MHLKSITIKGFKSFPDRTRLDFGEGVSVIVGPNGSGKSNITDAVLWALGEQSPAAVRGQTMQDVIFAGGHGVKARSEAEVELVLDNRDGLVDLPVSELSILRRVDRSGEGEYRLNGARCRLVDVLELLSDTGIGKEAHSVVSQGRVEAMVTSKPRDRRLLIEEAAGLGKHRKRRRRGQLKLDRTQENVDRVLDVEREARARLRPLKRQAEAAALHERLALQSDQARYELARDEARLRGERRAAAEQSAARARADRGAVEAELALVAARREAAEVALAQRGERHDEISRRAFAARSARDRVALRLDQTVGLAGRLEARAARRVAELAALRAAASVEAGAGGAQRIAELEAELELLDGEHAARLEREVAALEAERAAAAVVLAGLARERAALVADGARAEAELELARAEQRESELAIESARRGSARVGADLAAVNQFLRSHAAASGRPQALEHRLEAEPGYELALAAALGGRLAAVVVADRAAGEAELDRAGVDGGRALIESRDVALPSGEVIRPAGEVVLADGVVAIDALAPPAGGPEPGAVPLLEFVRAPADVLGLVARLLADVWVVERLEHVGERFAGIAVTRSGRVWNGGSGELRQVAGGGRERVLEERNRRLALIAATEQAAQVEQAALAAGRTSRETIEAALTGRDAADRASRDAGRAEAEARENERRVGWLIQTRRAAPEQGEAAVRHAQLAGELAAERRALDRAELARVTRERRIAVLAGLDAGDAGLVEHARRLTGALAGVGRLLEAQLADREAELAADREAGVGVAGELRACATAEAAIQARLRELGEAVTAAEVGAQQARDRAADAADDLAALAERLGLEAQAGEEPIGDEQRALLAERIDRLARRREQLGPVNPLAAEEYREALERVEELEAQRTDLETALRELRVLIRDTDRQIAEAFEAAFAATARNFEELVGDVFPGGRGRLRLVREDSGPRAVRQADADGAGAAGVDGGGSGAAGDAEARAEAEAVDHDATDELLGVEIEVTPAGKSMKRLTLLSGGEKSMTALAFLFAVFLARPCPFYILDEVEAALDDLNIDRFLSLLRRYSSRAQFIVVTHQKRTMEAADFLYGVSMGGDGVSKLVSRRLAAVQLPLGDRDGEAGRGEPATLEAAGAA